MSVQSSDNVTIAVIAPSDAVGEQLRRLLTGAGYTCKRCASIKRLSADLESDTSIDMIIFPLGDKERSDMELIKKIRRSPRTHYLPMIMLCSLCNSNLVVEAKQNGATSIVTVPIIEEVLLSRIQSGLADGRRVVLVVDDEPTVLDVLRLSLELERFKVITAGTAEEGLKVLESRTVHALVSDIILPGMDGLELLVKAKERFPELPVILMTGYSSKCTPKDAIAAGADGYFAKPFQNLQMVRTLRNAIYQREHRHSIFPEPAQPHEAPRT